MIKRALFICLMWLCFAMGAFAQNAVVSGVITDSSSQVWFGGSVQITFYPSPTNPSGPYFWQGAAFNTQQVFKAALNSSGAFSGLSIPSNNFITPSGSLWSVQVCPAASSNCYTTNVSLTQPTQNISSLVVPPPIKVNAAGVSQLSAYQDSEIVNPSLGTTYFNLTLNAVRACTVQLPCTWVTIGTGGGSGVSSFTGDGAFSCNTASTGSVIFDLCPTPVLPNGTTATTQTTGDNSTKVATDAFVIANAGGGGGSPAGSDTDVQINKAGVFGASSFLVVDNSTTPTTLNVGGNVVTKGPNPQIDVQAFGARPLAVNPQTTCSTSGAGPPYTTLNCASATGFIKGDGLAVYAAGAATAQTTPAAPSVTSPSIQGTSNSYSYECVGVGILDDLTAASASTTVATSPSVFGNPPVTISNVVWTGGLVTITTSTTFDANFSTYPANTKHANIVGMGAGLTSLNSYAVLITSEPTATSFTFALAGSGSGTFTGATARAINTFVGTAASRSGGTLTITTDISSNIKVNTAAVPNTIFLTGWSPADINGEYKLAVDDGDTVSGTTITINRQALNETETATQTGFVTVYEKNLVVCPNVVSPTVKYAIYGTSNPGGTMEFLGFTEYNQRAFTDWGYWIRNGSSGVHTPGWLPSTPPASPQNQILQTIITNISGNTLTVTNGAALPVTNATAVHDDAYAIVNAADSLPHTSNYANVVKLSPTLLTNCSTCYYHIESPLGVPQGTCLDVANPVIADETTYGEFNGLCIYKDQNAVMQYSGEAFGQKYYEPWIGHGNPLVTFLSGQNYIEGMYFGTTLGGGVNDDEQVLVQVDGSTHGGAEAEYGGIKDTYFSTGIATTSEGFVCVGQCDYFQIYSPVFNSSIPWHSGTSGTINWGPPIGAMELKCDDNTTGTGQFPGEMFLTGQPQFVGKGVLFNQVNCASLGFNFSIGSPSGGVDDQQPVTPLVMILGGPGGPNNLSIYHSTMDSVSIPMVGNWGRPVFWTLDSDSVSSGVPLISGSYIGNLTVKDPSYPAGALGQNIFLSLLTPINPTGVQGGLETSLLQVDGNANLNILNSRTVYTQNETGADLCTRIQQALTAAGNANAVIDARGEVGTQTCAVNAFANLTGSVAVDVYMPPYPITTSVAQVANANDLHIHGFGGTSASTRWNANSSLPASTAIFTLGASANQSNNLTIDHMSFNCTSGPSTCVDAVFYNLQEFSGSFFNNFIGANSSGVTGPCVLITNPAGGGHWNFLENSVGACGDNDAVEILQEATTGGHLDMITCNNTGKVTGNACVHHVSIGGTNNTISYDDHVHAEGYVYTCLFETHTGGSCDHADSTGTNTTVLQINSGALTVTSQSTFGAGTNDVVDNSTTPNFTATVAAWPNGYGPYSNVASSTLGPTVVGSLPSASAYAGKTFSVSDSTSIATEGQTCVGGSSTSAVAVSNGTIWKCF
jgi:hypothetical protein